MRRMSSPGAYSLCSENSIDEPACGFCAARERPLDDHARPHAHRFEPRDVLRIERQRRIARLGRLDGLDQPIDQLVRVQAIRLGVEVGQHPVDQHRRGQRGTSSMEAA